MSACCAALKMKSGNFEVIATYTMYRHLLVLAGAWDEDDSLVRTLSGIKEALHVRDCKQLQDLNYLKVFFAQLCLHETVVASYTKRCKHCRKVATAPATLKARCIGSSVLSHAAFRWSLSCPLSLPREA